MPAFSDFDVDRAWGQGELIDLSERQLTLLVWKKHYKNACFFGPFGVAIYYATTLFGWLGHAVGWAVLLMFAFFVLHSVFAGILRAVATAFEPSGWKILQVVIVFVSAAFYGLIMLVLWRAL